MGVPQEAEDWFRNWQGPPVPDHIAKEQAREMMVDVAKRHGIELPKAYTEPGNLAAETETL